MAGRNMQYLAEVADNAALFKASASAHGFEALALAFVLTFALMASCLAVSSALARVETIAMNSVGSTKRCAGRTGRGISSIGKRSESEECSGSSDAGTFGCDRHN